MEFLQDRKGEVGPLFLILLLQGDSSCLFCVRISNVIALSVVQRHSSGVESWPLKPEVQC